MRFACVLAIVMMSGCTAVDTDTSEVDSAAKTDDIPVSELPVEDSPAARYVHLFDVLQRYPKSGLGIFEDWVIVRVNTAEEKLIWSFPPVNHPAYPAAVRREILMDADSVQIRTRMNCTSSKVVCEQLFQDFIAMSEKVLSGS